jgi:hypothetical protein
VVNQPQVRLEAEHAAYLAARTSIPNSFARRSNNTPPLAYSTPYFMPSLSGLAKEWNVGAGMSSST